MIHNKFLIRVIKPFMNVHLYAHAERFVLLVAFNIYTPIT